MREDETVHIVDSDPAHRIALGRLLRSVGYAAHLYASAEEFIEMSWPDGPRCVMTEVRLQGFSGLELQQRLRALVDSPPLIVMTGFGDIQMSVQCMKAGAIDFLTKPFRDQEVIDAVATALQCDKEQRAASDEIACLRARFARLSNRERQVMTLVTSGKINKQVADLLELSEVTVKIHRGSAMKKMDAESLADFAVMAHRLDLHMHCAKRPDGIRAKPSPGYMGSGPPVVMYGS
jgi:FixJ family two-component response regulator